MRTNEDLAKEVEELREAIRTAWQKDDMRVKEIEQRGQEIAKLKEEIVVLKKYVNAVTELFKIYV